MIRFHWRTTISIPCKLSISSIKDTDEISISNSVAYWWNYELHKCMLFRPFSFDHLQQRLGDVPVKSLEETRVENILIEPEAASYVQKVRKGNT